MLALIGIAAVAALPALLPGSGTPVEPAGGALWPGAAEDARRELATVDEGQRLRAVLELARADAARATPLLLPLLRDRDQLVRLTVARLLARRDARAATAAATAWLGEAGARERLMGLLVLREAADLPEPARRAVERVLRNGDLTARLQGLELLAARPAPSSLGAVVAVLDDELAEVRLRALRALAAIADPRASLAVVRRLTDPDRGVRVEAAATLGALGDRRVVPALLRLLDESSPDPRAFVVDTLGRLGDPAALPALARLARRISRDDVARHATLALGALGTPEAVDALLALAREPPGADDVRVGLERAGPAAVPRLCREVATGSPTSARLAAEALGRLGDRRATSALVAAVGRGTVARVAALEALARLADPAALPALAHAATEGEAPELRVLALDALEATGDERALVVLPRALLDASPTVRARAARLAGKLGGSAQAAALVNRLGDGDVVVRREAAGALARLPALPTDLGHPLVDMIAAAPLDAPSLDALGDALERVTGVEDRPALSRAYLAAASPLARGAVARGLAAAFADAPLEDAAVVAALVRDVGEGGSLALLAAEALSHARLPRAEEAALGAAFARAEAPLRARLAPALTRFDAGVEQLAGALGAAAEAPSVRAAAAWALAGVADAREALRAAAASAEPAVAANARAALASASRRRARWSAVALADASGAAYAGRWVTVSVADGPPIWVMTDAGGRARVGGLPEGPVTLRLPPE